MFRVITGIIYVDINWGILGDSRWNSLTGICNCRFWLKKCLQFLFKTSWKNWITICRIISGVVEELMTTELEVSLERYWRNFWENPLIFFLILKLQLKITSRIWQHQHSIEILTWFRISTTNFLLNAFTTYPEILFGDSRIFGQMLQSF